MTAPLALRVLAALPLLVLGAGAAPAAAQTVVGAITEEGTARPLEGAFVVLVDADGQRLPGVLADADGRFALRATTPGRYRLVAELIGYGSTTTDWIDVAADATVRRDLAVAVEAVSLEGIHVETVERCHRRPGSGPETARLWEEARKALEVARWSEDRAALQFETTQHERELDARTLRVLSHQETGRRGWSRLSPFASIPAERLERGGYVQADGNGGYDFYAPDAAVLLSESFLRTHCFRVAGPPRDEPGLIGLAFEPVPERRLPEIEGVLWIDRATAELRRLDFRYVRLPFRHGDWHQVGGSVQLERLATGVWIVRRWHIRMPLEAEESGGFGNTREELRLLSMLEQGGEVRAARTASGRPLAEATGATLYGVITTADGAPIPGVIVSVSDTDRRATTGPDGAFRIPGLPAGPSTISLDHARLSPTDPSRSRTVHLTNGGATRLPLVLELLPPAEPPPGAAPGPA